jgi:hypothetical protein
MTAGPTGCPRLAALLRGAADDAQAERIIAAHIATCRDCVEAEAALAALVGRWRVAALLPLDADLERRLLDRLCGDRDR